MKKLLTILGAVGLTATTGITVIACGTNGDNSKPLKPEINLQINSSTIQINETTEIVIENYVDIKNDLEKFSLNIINQDDEKKPVLEQVDDFDSSHGKFTIKGLHKGTVNAIVMASFRDQDLGINPISSVLTITVTTEVMFVPIKAEEIEIPWGDPTSIFIEGYQDLKNKWEDFTLNFVNQDPNNKDKILKQDGDFDTEEGKFDVWGESAGVVKVTVSASLKEGIKPENLSFQSKTFATYSNEIAITVRKANFNGDIYFEEDKTMIFGAGLTGQETIDLYNKESRLIKYGEDFDFEFLNLKDLNKKVEIDEEIKIKALKNSKHVKGEYTFKVAKYDINLLSKSKKIKSVSIETREKEIRDMIKEAFAEVIEKESGIKVIENKDYLISIPKMVVGETIVVDSIRDSQYLINGFFIDIVDK